MKKSLDEIKRETVNKVVYNFDFHKVHRVMEFLNWTWYFKGVPCVSELEEVARDLLNDAFDGLCIHGGDFYQAATGGLVACMCRNEDEKGNPEIKGKLSFVLTEWDENM